MPINLKGRSLLTLLDLTQVEIRYLLDLSHALKAKKKSGIHEKMLIGKNIVLLFEKSSTRTRCSFEVAASEEGAHTTFLDASSSHIGKQESLEDSAKVLGRLYDGIEYRGYKQKVVSDLAKFSGVSVWNGLTDIDHPTQILADMMTIEEHVAKPLHKVKVVFVGDTRNNMSHAWMYGCAKMGMHFVAYGPKELHPTAEAINKLTAITSVSGGVIEVSDNIKSLEEADVIYTDVWVSMGEEAKIAERVKQLSKYRVTIETINATKNPAVIFMHCLPSFHDFETEAAQQAQAQGLDIREVDDIVFRSKHSVVFDEAENRMHTIKAVLVATL